MGTGAGALLEGDKLKRTPPPLDKTHIQNPVSTRVNFGFLKKKNVQTTVLRSIKDYPIATPHWAVKASTFSFVIPPKHSVMCGG